MHSVTKSEQDKNISIVEAQQCRNQEPEPFAFEIIDGLPVLAKTVYSKGKSFSYSDLILQLKQALKLNLGKSLGVNNIKLLISICKNRKWINYMCTTLYGSHRGPICL